MAILHYLTYFSTVVLASTTCITPPSLQVISKREWVTQSLAPQVTASASSLRPHALWNTSPWGWNATHISQSTGTATTGSRPTTTVTVGEAGKLVFSPSSLNASAGSVIAFNFLGLNHTLTESNLWDPCHSNQKFDTGFQQFNPANVSGKFIVEIEVTSQDAKWFFCAQTAKRSHCQAGMVFSLNPRGAHAQFLHNALAGIGVAQTPTNSVCELPSAHLTTSKASMYVAPTGTLRANSSVSSVAIVPPIFSSAGTTMRVSVWSMFALALL
jgi:plastocyanin